MPGKVPGKVPVHFFGTQEFAWMKRNDVVSFEDGLEAGMHICKASNRGKAAFKKALHEVSVYFLVSASSGIAFLQQHQCHFHLSHPSRFYLYRLLCPHTDLLQKPPHIYLTSCWLANLAVSPKGRS